MLKSNIEPFNKDDTDKMRASQQFQARIEILDVSKFEITLYSNIFEDKYELHELRLIFVDFLDLSWIYYWIS